MIHVSKGTSRLVVVSILVASLIAVLWPLLRPGFFVSDDGEWMVIRLSAFYQSLAGGQFPVRFLGRLNNSFGYPVANFLYPGFLYIGSFLRLLGLSFPIAVKFILGASVTCGALATFWALRTRFRVYESLLGTLSFVFAPYLLFDMYTRGSVGEVLALGASTLAILSLTRSWVWLFPPAVALLLMSHNIVALIVGLALVPIISIHPKRYTMIVSGLLGLGLAAFFWLPALFEKSFVRFDAVSVSDPFNYFIGYETAGLLGITTILAIAITMVKRTKHVLFDTIAMILATLGILMSTPASEPLWNIQALGNLVQFPYRFLVLPVLFGPWIVARSIMSLEGTKRTLLTLVFVIVWIVGAVTHFSNIQFVRRPEVFYTTNEGTTTVANEYMPTWVSEIPRLRAVETLEVSKGDATLLQRTFFGEKMVTEIDAKVTSIITVNKIYYPGWGVTIDNRRAPIDYSAPTGLMRVEVPKGKHTLGVFFRETPLRFAADAVSLFSMVAYVILLGRRRKRV